jgi:hypothetical protein
MLSICPKETKLKDKYFLELTVLLENHRTNKPTKILILQNVKRWFQNKSPIEAIEIAPDATDTLKLASKQQREIGWDHWIKGRWSQEWATLQNYDIIHNKSGKQHTSSKKWATEIMNLTWEVIHQLWLERNNSEHDSLGCPEVRCKEKLIEIIQGESIRMNYQIYSETDTMQENLEQLPVENLKMIQQKLKSAKADERIRKRNNM